MVYDSMLRLTGDYVPSGVCYQGCQAGILLKIWSVVTLRTKRLARHFPGAFQERCCSHQQKTQEVSRQSILSSSVHCRNIWPLTYQTRMLKYMCHGPVTCDSWGMVIPPSFMNGIFLSWTIIRLRHFQFCLHCMTVRFLWLWLGQQPALTVSAFQIADLWNHKRVSSMVGCFSKHIDIHGRMLCKAISARSMEGSVKEKHSSK